MAQQRQPERSEHSRTHRMTATESSVNSKPAFNQLVLETLNESAYIEAERAGDGTLLVFETEGPTGWDEGPDADYDPSEVDG